VSPHVGPLTDGVDRTFGASEAYSIVFRSLVDQGHGQLMRAFVVVTAWDLRHGCHSYHLSEIIRDEGWFMSQYMQSLTCPMVLSGPSVLAELNMRDGADGAFDAGPPACIPNSSPSHVRLNESTPMS
jgi:hypothetical protein